MLSGGAVPPSPAQTRPPPASGAIISRLPFCSRLFTASELSTLPNSMRIRRRLPIPLAVLLIVAAVALIVTLRKHAPPEAARLFPGADGFCSINREWVRKFNASQLPPVSREPEYQKFVEE